ncbi:hypothetical protein JOM56_011613 [Amanita muscaria]
MASQQGDLGAQDDYYGEPGDYNYYEGDYQQGEEYPEYDANARPLYDRIFGSEQSRQSFTPIQDAPHDQSLILRNQQPGYYDYLLRRFERVNLMGQKLRKDEVLKQDNWMAWKSRILQTLRANRLDGFPLGNYKAPEKNREPAEHDAWDIMDQAVIQFIKANIHSNQLISIPKFLEIGSSSNTIATQTSAETWTILCQVYKSHSTQTVTNLIFPPCSS